jgi:hypothetical protein
MPELLEQAIESVDDYSRAKFAGFANKLTRPMDLLRLCSNHIDSLDWIFLSVLQQVLAKIDDEEFFQSTLEIHLNRIRSRVNSRLTLLYGIVSPILEVRSGWQAQSALIPL